LAVTPSQLADLPVDEPGGRSGVYRIIAADLGAVAFFEQLTPGADADALLAVLSLTSPTLPASVGDRAKVPAIEWAEGPGAGWVMPAFTRRSRPTRFSDGRFGIWYVAWDLETAIAETLYHESRRLRETNEPAQNVARQVLTANVAGFAAILSQLGPPLGPLVHDPNSYDVSQQVGLYLRSRGSDAIVYRSVRRTNGTCTGLLRPRAVRGCRRAGLITCAWDGATLTSGPMQPV
jgi:hypothetical protein